MLYGISYTKKTLVLLIAMASLLQCSCAQMETSGSKSNSQPQNQDLTLVGWGIDFKNLDKFFADAESVGFDVLVTWSIDVELLKKAVEAGEKHNIKIFSSIAPMGEDVINLWKKEYPQKPFPWQMMDDNENAAATFLSAGRNKHLIPYQWGGEPLMTNEVLLYKIICFNNVEGRSLFEMIIDNLISVPEIEGIGFDGFGYQNYYSCHCRKCQEKLDEYHKKYSEISKGQASVNFYRDILVDYINHLANYARSKKKEIKTTIHIWPVFVPEPLYGNRLDVDYCGQTAAWFTLWPEEKIAKYSRVISEQAKKSYQRQQGVAMIGYYDRPGQFPVKNATCVDMEIKTMIENGCNRIQVCGAKDVINNEKIAEVFKKYFK
jgi:hypothetical protein